MSTSECLDQFDTAYAACRSTLNSALATCPNQQCENDTIAAFADCLRAAVDDLEKCMGNVS